MIKDIKVSTNRYNFMATLPSIIQFLSHACAHLCHIITRSGPYADSLRVRRTKNEKKAECKGRLGPPYTQGTSPLNTQGETRPSLGVSSEQMNGRGKFKSTILVVGSDPG